MFTNVDPHNPARVEERNWFKPAFPHVRVVKAIESWKGGEKFKLLTHQHTTQAAMLFLEDHLRVAKNHVKKHVSHTVTNAEKQDKTARNCVLTMLDLHPTGEAGEEAPAEGALDVDNAAKLALYQSHVVKTLLYHTRDVCDEQIVIRLNAWRLSHHEKAVPQWQDAVKTTMPKRVNNTACFDLATFIVLRRGEGHAARTWLKAVAQHKARLSKGFKIPESAFVHMLLSQLTRDERKSSIDAVDDPSGIIALTWEKASEAVAGLAPANHALFSSDMCGSTSLAYHPLKAVTAKSSAEEKEAAKAGSTLMPGMKNKVLTLKNEAETAAKTAKNEHLRLKNELAKAKAQLKRRSDKPNESKKKTPCKWFFSSGLTCRFGDKCRFSHDEKDKKKSFFGQKVLKMTHRKRKRGGSRHSSSSNAATDNLVENVGKFQTYLNDLIGKPKEKHAVKMMRKSFRHEIMSDSESDEGPESRISRMHWDSE